MADCDDIKIIEFVDAGPQGPGGPPGPKGDQGATGSAGPRGDQGLQGNTGGVGPKGDQGANGTNGAAWYTGTSAPAPGIGVPGDWYINTATGDVYNKVSGGWGSPVLNITAASGVVRYDVAQSLTPAQKRATKGNIGAFGVAYGGAISQATVLTPSFIGTVSYLLGATFQITLPAMSQGDSLKLFNASAYPKTVVAQTGAALNWDDQGGQGLVYTLPPYSKAVFECYLDNGSCIIFDSPAIRSTPSVEAAQSFTRAQMLQGRRNIGAGIALGGLSAATTLLTSGLNGTVYLLGDGYAVTLPAIGTTASGDWVEFTNIGTGTITVQRAAADTAAPTGAINYEGLTSGSLAVGPGQTLKLTSNGVSIWVASGRSLTPGRAVGTDAQTFTASQRKQIKTNIGALGASYAYCTSNAQLAAALVAGASVFLDVGVAGPVAMPALNEGEAIRIYNHTGGPITITASAIYLAATGGTSVVLKPYETVEFVCYATGTSNFIAFASGPATSSVLNADAAQAFTAAQQAQLATNMGFVTSDGTSGYTKFPNGQIRQWGLYAGGALNPSISFLTAFPGALRSLVATAIVGPAATEAVTVDVDAVSTSGFTGKARLISGGTVQAYAANFYWEASGK